MFLLLLLLLLLLLKVLGGGARKLPNRNIRLGSEGQDITDVLCALSMKKGL
jgi:hypothetical protein